jgi:hypothetical protein
VLGKVFEVFRMANRSAPLLDKRRMKGQFNVGRWLGAILYDILVNPDDTRQIQDKWAAYILRVRREDDPRAEEASSITGAQNLTASFLKKISTKVAIYLRDNRIATEAEIKEVVHHTAGAEEGADDESEGAYEENDV